MNWVPESEGDLTEHPESSSGVIGEEERGDLSPALIFDICGLTPDDTFTLGLAPPTRGLAPVCGLP